MINWRPFGKLRHVQCPDGERSVYRDIDAALPIFLSDVTSARSGSVANLESLGLKGGTLETQKLETISHVLYQIDEMNRSLMLDFRTVYLVFQADPCNKLDFLERRVEELQHEQARLRDLRLKLGYLSELASSGSNAVEVLAAFRQLVATAGGPAAPMAIKEIQRTRQIAGRGWGGGLND